MSRQSSAKYARAISANTKLVDISKLDLTIEDVSCRFYTPNKNLRNGLKFPLMVKYLSKKNLNLSLFKLFIPL